jgi:hypothetical protein
MRRAGLATLFYGLRPDGQLDPFSLHAGCPPTADNGTKWAVNKWFWTEPWVPQEEGGHFDHFLRKSRRVQAVDSCLFLPDRAVCATDDTARFKYNMDKVDVETQIRALNMAVADLRAHETATRYRTNPGHSSLAHFT